MLNFFVKITFIFFVSLIIACELSGGDDPEKKLREELPLSVGTNEVSGRTYLDKSYDSSKIVFSAADSNGNSTYEIYSVNRQAGDLPFVLSDSGKYTYTCVERGFYSWNENDKSVIFKAEKAAVAYSYYSWTELLDEIAFEEYLKEIYQEQLELVDEYTNLVFSLRYKNYDISETGDALFLDDRLPVSVGKNEFDKKVFYGTKYETPTFTVIDETITYIFKSSSYTKYKDEDVKIDEGYYSWDIPKTLIYFKPFTEEREDIFRDISAAIEYYETIADAKAAYTNDRFNRITKTPFVLSELVIGTLSESAE